MSLHTIRLAPAELAPVRRALERQIEAYEKLIQNYGLENVFGKSKAEIEDGQTRLYEARHELANLRSALKQIKGTMNG
jgi:archaellum component FlaC